MVKSQVPLGQSDHINRKKAVMDHDSKGADEQAQRKRERHLHPIRRCLFRTFIMAMDFEKMNTVKWVQRLLLA